MQIKSISYHRVINLGNYESKRLELFAEVQEGEDPEAAISSLAELVERKARESFELIFDVRELKRERRKLSEEVDRLKAEKDKLSGVEADPDDIPFNQTPQAPKDDPNENF
ncbi:MAG: hypothetical protein V7L09_33600 [Nostoc sp.]|uniref:hypothetical protein n=1 Tax=Nostoc sp. TaxID=1180 RepID=UPI002FF1F53C